MPAPWIAIFDAAIGLANMALARRERGRTAAADDSHLPAGSDGPAVPATLETHLAGVVVAALKEVFERDSRRLDLEREMAEAERQRAERAMRLELLRQAGEREVGRLRLMAGVAVVSWLGTLLLFARAGSSPIAARAALGSGWACLLAALACVFVGLSRVNRTLAFPDHGRDLALQPGPASALAAWFLLAGLGLVGVTVFLI